MKLENNYINSVKLRVLPSTRKMFNISEYNSLLESKEITSYFSRYYPFQEIPGTLSRLKKSSFYDHSFMEKVRSSLRISRGMFFENIKKAQSHYTRDFKSTLNQIDIDLVLKLLKRDVFRKNYNVRLPSIDEVLTKQNLRASSGLPDVYSKKRGYYLR
jgi:hypothetical protein